MKKEVAYSRTVFSADVIREALRAATADQDEEQITSGLRTVRRGNETWTFDSDEKFLASIVVSLLPLCLLHYGRENWSDIWPIQAEHEPGSFRLK